MKVRFARIAAKLSRPGTAGHNRVGRSAPFWGTLKDSAVAQRNQDEQAVSIRKTGFFVQTMSYLKEKRHVADGRLSGDQRTSRLSKPVLSIRTIVGRIEYLLRHRGLIRNVGLWIYDCWRLLRHCSQLICDIAASIRHKPVQRQTWIKACMQFSMEHIGDKHKVVIMGRLIKDASVTVGPKRSGAPIYYCLYLRHANGQTESLWFTAKGRLLTHQVADGN